MIGDPDQLDGLATQLRAYAEEVRVVAGDHVRAGQAAHWVSAAGQEYRDRIWDDRTAAYAAADEMDTAAGLVNAHADAVRERLAAIAAAAAAALEAARETAEDVGEVVVAGAEVVVGVAEDVGETTLEVVTFGLYDGDDD